MDVDVNVDVMMYGLIPFLLCPLLQGPCGGPLIFSFVVNGSRSSTEGAKDKGSNLLCIRDVKGKAKTTP